jgi:hypothetical protein
MVDVRTNLLKKRETLSEKDYQKERTYLRWSIVSFVVVMVSVVALGAWNFILARKLSGIEQAITTSSKEMQGLAQASAQQVYLKSRLQLVTGFLANRSLARESLQKIFLTSIPGTHVAGVAFESENVMSVQYGASTFDALNQLLEYYQSETGYFTQVISKGITKAKDGTYLISLAMTLPKEGK